MSDKVENEIFELIKKSNFKQCNERISQLRKQFPKSAFYQVLEIFIKYKQSPGKFDYNGLLGSKFGLQGKSFTSDSRSLQLLHRFFIELERYEEALNVYEQAIFRYPGFELAGNWFEKALADSNYKQMAKASLQLAKYGNSSLTPSIEGRDYSFWYALSILALFKFQKDTITDQEQKLFPLLSYKCLTAAKPFKSSEEIIVFCMVCEELFPNNEKKSKEIIQEILPGLKISVNLSLKNFISRHSLKLNDYEVTFESSTIILKNIDDYDVIKGLIKASKELGKPKQDTKNLILSLVGDSRNSRLSQFECDIVYDNVISDESLTHYLSKYYNKPCCPVDISVYRDKVDEDTLCSIMKKFGSDDLIYDANVYKLNLQESNSSELFFKHSNELNTKSKTDYSSSSVFILDLVENSLLKDSITLDDILFSLSLLENFQAKDPHNFDTKLWIIILYMHLGCVPLAFSHYLDLKIKNVQNDLLDHLIYSRMSTLFPQKQHDFFKKFNETNATLYEGSLNRLTNFIQISIERKAYSKFSGMLEFRDRLEKSSTKWMKQNELLQLSRLCNDKRGPLIEKLHTSWRSIEITGSTALSDNRDWSCFGKNIKKDNLPEVFQYMNVNETAIKLGAIRENMIDLILSNDTNKKFDIYMDTIFNGNMDVALSTSLSEPEKWSFDIFFDVYKNNSSNLKTLLANAPVLLNTSGTWKLSHIYLTKLATLKTLDNVKRIKDKGIKALIKSQIAELRDLCDDMYKSYSNIVAKECSNLSKGKHGELLKFLNFEPIEASMLTDCIISVQKTVRNL